VDLLKLGEINMADVMFPRQAPKPRELDTRMVSDDYRPRRVRTRVSSDADSENYRTEELNEHHYSEPSTEISSQVNLGRLEHQLRRNPLDEIATMVRALTYGEMMEFAQAIWKIRPEGEGVSQDTLPMLLHRWSTSFEH
jgi:hypothetical protein